MSTTVAPDAYQLLPALPPDDYERLKSDIAERGIMVPIEVDEDGNILDGHHRARIAKELGLDCPTKVRPFLEEHEKRLHAVALNLARRHLTDAQKVLLGRRIEPDVAERARQRQGARTDLTSGSSVPKVDERSRDEVAQQVGLGSGRTYERARDVMEKAEALLPDVAEKAAAGELTMRDVAKAVRQEEKALRVEAIAQQAPPDLTTFTEFPVLYVDPPWRYEHAEPTRAIENHYPTMSADELKAMEIPAADDSVLFMWATSPKLAEALDLMAAWGYGYRTCMVWVKDRIGMGYYARQRHELLLIGKKGNVPTPYEKHRPDSVQAHPLGAHSAKPEAFYDLIDTMYPGLAKVELFARSTRDGWAAWGNQA